VVAKRERGRLDALRELALLVGEEDRDAVALERLAQAVRGDAERVSRLVSERKPWESCVRAMRSRRSLSSSRRRRRDRAESRPMRRAETRKTKSAATFRGSSTVRV
jgi:hypothetical protein